MSHRAKANSSSLIGDAGEALPRRRAAAPRVAALAQRNSTAGLRNQSQCASVVESPRGEGPQAVPYRPSHGL
jgi:hypothetical protein